MVLAVLLVIMSSSSITNSYAMVSVSGGDFVGGLVGYNVISSNIDNSYATGSVSGSSYVGGLVGDNVIYSIIDNSYATGSVSGGLIKLVVLLVVINQAALTIVMPRGL